MLDKTDIEKFCVINRKRRGRGFEYFDPLGNKIAQKSLIKRFRDLGIPPMWANVGISQDSDSHVQAIGYDKKGRKQYIYHPVWQRQQQQEKFNSLAEFAKELPAIRQRYRTDCDEQTWSLRYVTAIATWILDESGIRIGNKAYTEQNDTYGLTTLRRRHINTSAEDVQIEFVGKHNKPRSITIEDDELASLVQTCSEQPGYSLLRYQHKGRWTDVCSDDVNSYIKTISNDRFSSKFFRTWTANRLAVNFFDECNLAVNMHPRKKFKSTLVKMVAKQLGNTPAICEAYYIHPNLLKALVDLHQKQQSTADIPIQSDDSQGLMEPEEWLALKLMGAT